MLPRILAKLLENLRKRYFVLIFDLFWLDYAITCWFFIVYWFNFRLFLSIRSILIKHFFLLKLLSIVFAFAFIHDLHLFGAEDRIVVNVLDAKDHDDCDDERKAAKDPVDPVDSKVYLDLDGAGVGAKGGQVLETCE